MSSACAATARTCATAPGASPSHRRRGRRQAGDGSITSRPSSIPTCPSSARWFRSMACARAWPTAARSEPATTGSLGEVEQAAAHPAAQLVGELDPALAQQLRGLLIGPAGGAAVGEGAEGVAQVTEVQHPLDHHLGEREAGLGLAVQGGDGLAIRPGSLVLAQAVALAEP